MSSYGRDNTSGNLFESSFQVVPFLLERFVFGVELEEI
jgi:hypothetical protein